MSRNATSSGLFSVVALAVIVYASLYPLTGWDHPLGWQAWRAVRVPWPARSTPFDTVSNVLGYWPLGLLVTLALVRGSGWRTASAMIGAVLLAGLLSASMEVLQNFLPRRVPSALDWVCNVAGAGAGALAAGLLVRLGWIESGLARLDRWFEPGAAVGTTLLVLWPLALLFPTPTPLVLGQVFDELAEGLLSMLQGSALAEPVREWLALPAVATPALRPPLAPAVEATLVAVSLLSPCLLAFSVTWPGWRRAVLAAGALALAVGSLTLSTALNFGPNHALAWQTPAVWQGLGAGFALACLLAAAPSRVAAVLGVAAIVAMVSLGLRAPADPYFAVSLAAWEQGRFIRFHGLAQWIGWWWPYAALVYLAMRASGRATGVGNATFYNRA
jgi:VanZ family protein